MLKTLEAKPYCEHYFFRLRKGEIRTSTVDKRPHAEKEAVWDHDLHDIFFLCPHCQAINSCPIRDITSGFNVFGQRADSYLNCILCRRCQAHNFVEIDGWNKEKYKHYRREQRRKARESKA
jgi:hypothetical protein